MKNVFILFALIAISSLTVQANVEPVVKSINVEKSTLNWKGYKVLGSHEGTLAVQSGELMFDGESLTGGSFTIDMAAINCTDLEGESKGNLEGHLKSDDFFGVATYPTAKFEITRVVSRGKAGDYKVIGNLTIKNTTKEIKFDANVADGSATASLKIDRSDFNVKYGSGSFFDGLGDRTIYDEFDLEVNLAY